MAHLKAAILKKGALEVKPVSLIWGILLKDAIKIGCVGG
jgi:hypothetical protein